jgi:hypothetical protein
MFAVALGSIYQISNQVFAPVMPVEFPYANCAEGLTTLHSTIAEGRRFADRHADGASSGSEYSLRQFRQRLKVTWQHRERIANLCGNSKKERRALATIERLRYAEEHGVRFRAAEILPLRLAAEQALQSAQATP